MPLVQKIDEKKFIQKPVYSYIGSGLKTKCCRTHPLFLKQDGEGFADFLSNLIPNVASLISENKDTIGSVANSVGSVANSVGGIASAAKSISDTIKTSKELEKIKTIHNSNKKKKKDVELTPEHGETWFHVFGE